MFSHWFWLAAGHCEQLVLVQSTAQPVLRLQFVPTNGATQLKRPVPSANEKWNGSRQAAHDGAVVSRKLKYERHEALLGPGPHAARASARSAALHTVCGCNTLVVTPAGHAP